MFAVDLRIGLQIVRDAAQPPRPSSDGAPLAVFPHGVGAILAHRGPQTVLPAIRVVGLDVAIVGSGHGKAGLEDHFERPAAAFGAASGLGGLVIDDMLLLALTHPAGGKRHILLRAHRMVSAKAEADNARRGLHAIRDVNHHIHAPPCRTLRQRDVDDFPRRQPAQCIHLRRRDLKLRRTDIRRRLAIHMLLKQRQNLPAP